MQQTDYESGNDPLIYGNSQQESEQAYFLKKSRYSFKADLLCLQKLS